VNAAIGGTGGPRALVWATDLDVLAADSPVERDGDHLVVRLPDEPSFWWGNFLLYDEPPAPGDGERWEAAFAAAFRDMPAVCHRTFGWDTTDGSLGSAHHEFLTRGYELERRTGLLVDPEDIRDHPRANAEVLIQPLNPAPGRDEPLWEQVLTVAVDSYEDPGQPREALLTFARRRQDALRCLFEDGRGAWYAAIDPTDGSVVGGCGVVATGSRGRFQSVGVVASHRRRGIASRLVAQAGRDAAAGHGLETLVISADPDYHALGLYTSLGFRAVEHVVGVQLPPST